MIKIYRISDYDARKDHKSEFRRGFVLPSKYEWGKVLFVVDDKHIDHERLADNLVALSREEIDEIVIGMGVQTQEEYQNACKSILAYQKKYKELKEKYPVSRKDYLIYEEGAVAFDEKGAYGKKFVIFRDSSRHFRIDSQTEKILSGYAAMGWNFEPAPENNLNASNERFL
jgi:hypothetical protein